MSVLILRGDAARIPLPDGCVDLVVTSPPYFGLRSYTDGGVHYDGQVGSEATPAAYIDALVGCTREWTRVLKPEGSLFVNLGDKYASSAPGKLGPSGSKTAYARDGYRSTSGFAPEKCLLALPWRYALAACDQLGLILRRDIIWAKPNGLPESVMDRCRSSHEYVFHLVRQPRYYSSTDEIREPYAPATAKRYAAGYNERAIDGKRLGIGTNLGGDTYGENPLGKLPGSVWTIPSQPLTVPPALGVDHFAAFPVELPRRIIAGWSPPGICVECGQGRRPVSQADYVVGGAISVTDKARSLWQGNSFATRALGRAERLTAITGYACACPEPSAPARPAVVLDPFGGTGTTALAALALGRHAITIDLSQDYCRLAAWRTSDRREIAAAMQVPRPEPVPDDQMTLFTDLPA